jgi:dihydrofolate synthase/folylpolyglutamate synthase
MKPISNFAEANRVLSNFYPNSGTDYSLDNIRVLMQQLGNPQNKFRAVHVAGTSGKTSTAYYISALLTAAGKKIGLTVSPHVDQLSERAQINGQPIAEAVFCKALSEFLELIGKVDVKPSWFEVMVAFAFWYFAREQVDYAVVEVGLGGLLDGTNVIDRTDKVCVITDIGLDHVEVLGANLAAIAAQKIGIVQDGNEVFTYRQEETVMKVFEDWCERRSSTLQVIENPARETDYRQRNWELAHRAVEFLAGRDELPKLRSEQLKATQNIVIPGRMDIRQVKGKTVVMDGAHNVQKMTAFLKSFRQLYPGSKPAALISLKEGKEYEKLVPLIARLADNIIITTFSATQDLPSQSMDPELLAKAFKAAGKQPRVISDQVEAVRELLESPEPVAIITGSFYLLSQIRNNGLLDD